MKQKGKKVLGFVACSMLFATTAMGLAACGGETHDFKEYSEKAATCTEAGYKHHYECSECGKYFADAEGKTELKKEDVDLPATGHDVQKHAKTDATCTEEGYSQDYWYCANGCGTIWSDNGNTVMTDTEDLIIPATEHKGTIHHVDYEAATIDKDGHIAHWHCDLCEKDFEDEFGDNKIENVSIPKLEEIAANVNVFVYDGDGKPVTDTSGLALTLTSNVKTYTNVTVSDGKLSIDKMYEGEYTVTVTGYEKTKITVGKTAVELLLIPSFIQNSNQHDKGTVSWSVAKTEGGISKSVTLDAVDEWSAEQLEAKHTEAQFLLTDEQKNASAFALYTTIKFQNTKNEKGAIDRGGFLLTKNAATDGKDYGGFVLYCETSEIHDMPRNHGAGITLNQEHKLATYDLYEALGAGMQVRIMRLNTLITFSVWENDEWKLLCTNTCSEGDINDIRFLGASGKWEFSNVVIETDGKLEVVSAVDPTPEKDGNVAHYTLTKGTEVKYFLMNGTETTAEGVVLPRLQQVDVSVSVKVFNYDGTTEIEETIPADLEFTLTDGYGQSMTATVAEGKLSLNKMYQDKYTVTAFGYTGSMTVGDDAEITLNLVKTFATETNKNERITITYGNDKSITMDCSEANEWDGDQLGGKRGEVALNLTDAQKNAKNITVEFTVKVLRNTNAWAGDRFGVRMTNTCRGYVFWSEGGTRKRLDEMKNTGDLDQWDYDTTFDHYDLLTAADGLTLRIERVGTTIRLSYYANGGWNIVYTSRLNCGEDDTNDIRFLGANAKYEFSNITVTTPTTVTKEDFPYQAPTVSEFGQMAHYTITVDGVVSYYLPDGTHTTLEDLKIDKIVEATVSVSVTPLDYDGTAVDPIAANTAVKLTAADATYDTTVTADGKLARTTFAKGTYVVEIEGYATGRLVIGDDAQAELVVYKPFATNSNKAGQSTVKEETYQTATDSVYRKVTLFSNGDGVTPIYDNRAEVKISLSATEQTAKNITVSGKLKFTGANDHLARAGMTMTEGWNGFVLYHASNRIDKHPGEYKLDQTEQLGSISYDELTAGIEFRMVRTGTTIRLYIKNANGWVLRASVSCAEDAANDIRFAGGLGTWEYTELAVTVPTYAKHDYVAPTASAAGMLPYYTLANGSVTENYMMNGVWIASLDGLALPQLGENVAITVANQFNSASTEGNANITGNTAVITKNKWADDSNTITLTPESGVGTDFVLNFNVKIEGNLTGATERMAFSLSTTGDVYRIYNLGGWKIGHGQRMDDNNKWLDQDKGEAATAYGNSINAAITSADGLNLSLIRQGNTVTVLAQLGGEWVKLDSFAVSGDAEFKLHYGGDFDGNQTWTFSDITLNTLAAQD